MKSFLAVILVASYLVACTQALPGFPRDEDTDMVVVLPEDARGRFGMRSYDSFDSDSEEDAGGFLIPSFYNGFMTRVEDALKRIRDQMTGFLSRGPESSVIGPWGKIPEGANTTSTTKIINGHVVTINETIYRDTNDEFGTLIRVRVIDVKPQNETILMAESGEGGAEMTTLPNGLAEEESTTAARSVETVEEFDNDIPRNQVDTLTA